MAATRLELVPPAMDAKTFLHRQRERQERLVVQASEVMWDNADPVRELDFVAQQVTLLRTSYAELASGTVRNAPHGLVEEVQTLAESATVFLAKGSRAELEDLLRPPMPRRQANGMTINDRRDVYETLLVKHFGYVRRPS
jgi:hypothetical protein